LEAYTFLENALKIFEREMMLAILDLDSIHFDAQEYHNQTYSARLLGDATAMFNGTFILIYIYTYINLFTCVFIYMYIYS
jgi:hypothetical protein